MESRGSKSRIHISLYLESIGEQIKFEPVEQLTLGYITQDEYEQKQKKLLEESEA